MRTVEEIQNDILVRNQTIEWEVARMARDAKGLENSRSELERFRAELAEAQKPKLKTGDICLSKNDCLRSRIVVVPSVYGPSGMAGCVKSVDNYTPAIANIFDLLDQGPILVPMSVEEAEHIKSISWVDSLMRGASRKCKAQLQAYRNATA